MAVLWSSFTLIRCSCRCISGIWSTNDRHYETGIWRTGITTSHATAAVIMVTDGIYKEWILSIKCLPYYWVINCSSSYVATDVVWKYQIVNENEPNTVRDFYFHLDLSFRLKLGLKLNWYAKVKWQRSSVSDWSLKLKLRPNYSFRLKSKAYVWS